MINESVPPVRIQTYILRLPSSPLVSDVYILYLSINLQNTYPVGHTCIDQKSRGEFKVAMDDAVREERARRDPGEGEEVGDRLDVLMMLTQRGFELGRLFLELRQGECTRGRKQ